MAVKMKVLKPFKGIEGRPRRGAEIEVQSERRADELEALGIAERRDAKRTSKTADDTNKASASGPTSAPAGGETGGGEPSSSSRAAPAQDKKQTSTSSKK